MMIEKLLPTDEDARKAVWDVAEKNLRPEILPALEELRNRLSQLGEWRTELLHATIAQCAEDYQLKLGKLAQPIRVAVCGKTASPPIDVTLALLGQERTLARLDRAIRYIRSGKA